MSTVEYREWGPEELCRTPLWLDNLPAISSPLSWDTSPEFLREGQPRVLKIDSGQGESYLHSSLDVFPERTYHLTVEALGQGADLQFGIKFTQGVAQISAELSSDYQVYSGLVTLPGAVSDPRPWIAKSGGEVRVAMVSIREVTSKTSAQGWLSAYQLAPSAGDGFVSADGEVILLRDHEGNVIGSIGPRQDGTSGITLWEGAVPPVPTGLSAVGQVGGVLLTWDGKFVGDATKPGDLDWVEVYSSDKDFSTVAQAEYKGTLSAEGGTFLVPGLPTDDVYVGLRSKSQAKKTSAMSDTVHATPMSVLDGTEYAQRLEDAEEAIDAAAEWISITGAQLSSNLSQAELDLIAAQGRLSTAEQDILNAFGDISDLRSDVDGAVVDTKEQWATSASPTSAPLVGWSDTPPVWTAGVWVWKRTVVTFADESVSTGAAVLTTGPPGESGGKGDKGEDAAILRISSSRGTTFKNNTASTTLSVTVFYGADQITNITGLQDSFGMGAYLEWWWRRKDDESFGVISSADDRLSAAGFAFTISADDVDEQVVFQCILHT